jgi:hypothetical protein
MRVTLTFSDRTDPVGTFPTEVSVSIEMDEDANIYAMERRLMEMCRAALLVMTYNIDTVKKVFTEADKCSGGSF